jgi:hypothetical protein
LVSFISFLVQVRGSNLLIARNLLFGLMCMDRKRRGSKGGEKGGVDKADRLKAEILK